MSLSLLAWCLFVFYVNMDIALRSDEGLYAAVATTTLSTVWHAHDARFDIPLAFGSNLTLFGLYVVIARRESLKRRFPILLGGGGLLLPLLGAYAYRLGGDFNANFFVNENLVVMGRAMGRAPRFGMRQDDPRT